MAADISDVNVDVSKISDETWEKFIGGLDVSFKGNTSELAFEEDNFDDFLKNLDELELVHPLVEHSWGQRVVRFYDPDGHIIEVG
ncbi:MAG: hypothetical protein LBN34_06890, partial [Clostridiales Family XIII bacterium]|nr:hypothetical protein [Clostridiales Family XIII bacterium]